MGDLGRAWASDTRCQAWLDGLPGLPRLPPRIDLPKRLPRKPLVHAPRAIVHPSRHAPPTRCLPRTSPAETRAAVPRAGTRGAGARPDPKTGRPRARPTDPLDTQMQGWSPKLARAPPPSAPPRPSRAAVARATRARAVNVSGQLLSSASWKRASWDPPPSRQHGARLPAFENAPACAVPPPLSIASPHTARFVVERRRCFTASGLRFPCAEFSLPPPPPPAPPRRPVPGRTVLSGGRARTYVGLGCIHSYARLSRTGRRTGAAQLRLYMSRTSRGNLPAAAPAACFHY